MLRTRKHYLALNKTVKLAITELHSAIFIAIKRPVVTGRNWPTAANQRQYPY